MTKGDKYERELVDSLEATGMAAMRAPGSGGRTDAARPDVVAAKRTKIGLHPIRDETRQRDAILANAWAIELKSGSDARVYVEEDEAEQLLDWANRFGAVPLIGARFTDQSSPTHVYLLRLGDCARTDRHNYAVAAEDAAERAHAIVETGDDPTVRMGGVD